MNTEIDSDSSVAGSTASSDNAKDVPPQENPEGAFTHPITPIALHAPELEDGVSFRPVLSEHDPDFDFLYEVYQQSFPEDERRNREQLLEEMGQTEACVGLISYQGERAGLFIYWELEDFIYLGHFAIHEDFRGDGIGALFLSQILRWASLPVVLEVEHPTNKISKRRIAFYERLGLKLFECNYYQPSYQKGQPPVPLYLMSAPAHTTGYNEGTEYILPEQYNEVVDAMYEYVYEGCDIPEKR